MRFDQNPNANPLDEKEFRASVVSEYIARPVVDKLLEQGVFAERPANATTPARTVHVSQAPSEVKDKTSKVRGYQFRPVKMTYDPETDDFVVAPPSV